MSDIEKRAALQTNTIKKAFPNPGVLLSRKISSITTTTGAGTNQQSDATGVRSITITPLSYPILFCWGAPAGATGDAIVASWFADATTDANGLQYIYVPAGTTRTEFFDPPITRWDYQAVGTATAAYQEIQR